MYDIVKSLIDHVWSSTTSTSTEQQTIYYIVGALICVLSAVFVDLAYKIISSCFIMFHRKD